MTGAAESGRPVLVLPRERALAVAGLGALTLTAWLWLFRQAASMEEMAVHLGMPEMWHWGPAEVALLVLMWAVMMTAMMTPSALPLVLLHAHLCRARGQAGIVRSAALLVAGYLLAWTGFSGFAALIQWRLHEAALLSPMMASTSPRLGGALLVLAGVYQMSPLKGACLTRCRSPLAFLMSEWRAGPWGAVRMGLRHGLWCLGCCWTLMGVLLVVGVMNLMWVAALAAFVLVEKAAPYGARIGRVAGAGLVLGGLAVLVRPLFDP